MIGISLSARFRDGEALCAALGDLRRLGAVRCREELGAAPGSGGAVLHLTVRPADASMARAILRRAGGTIFQGP